MISNHKDNTNRINIAEGCANSSYNWPNMNWAAADLSKEWERFYQHCEFTFGLQVMAGEDPRVAVNLKLNFDKVRVRKQQVPYVGHIISAEGLKPDPEKVSAMKEMPPPTTKEDVLRFLGSIQYLAKFLPMVAEVETPPRELTKRDVLFHWDAPQAEAFQRLKDLCCTAQVLAYYDVKKETTIQCDASKNAVGEVLLQEGRPVAYASRKLLKSELNWAPIEKEMLAIVSAVHTSSENTSWGKPHWYKLTISQLKRYCANLCQWHRCACKR